MILIMNELPASKNNLVWNKNVTKNNPYFNRSLLYNHDIDLTEKELYRLVELLKNFSIGQFPEEIIKRNPYKNLNEVYNLILRVKSKNYSPERSNIPSLRESQVSNVNELFSPKKKVRFKSISSINNDSGVNNKYK